MRSTIRPVLLSLALDALVLAAPAEAHTLSKERARKAAARFLMSARNVDSFTTYRVRVDTCRRRSRHKVICRYREREIEEDALRQSAVEGSLSSSTRSGQHQGTWH